MSLLDLFGRKPTVEQLAREIIASAAAAGAVGWRFEPSTTALVKDGSDAIVHLVNFFLEYSQASRRDRDALVEKYATLLSTVGHEIPKLWTLAQKNVYAVIRSRHDRAALEIAHRGADKRLPERVEFPWHDDLVVRIVYDFGPSMGQVDTSIADTWGISRAELLETAKRNLRTLPKPGWRTVAPGVFQVASAVSYEESMLLRDDVWDNMGVAGDVVAIPANRGVLLAASSDDTAALEALLEQARQSLQNKPWPLDPVIVVRRNGDWAAYDPTGRAAVLWRLHCKISHAGAYAEQQEALQKHLGDDVFVAGLTLMNRKDDLERPVSYAVWTEGVRTLLPEADLLAFSKARADGKFDTVLVQWTDAHRLCGARMTAVAEQPPRWMVDTFPGPEEWQALLAAQFTW